MGAQAFAVFVAGLVAPFVIQVIKNYFGQNDKGALWLAFGVSVVIAVVALLVTGELPSVADPTQLGAAIGVVFSIATVVYKQFMAKAPN